jgi:hypothetical protein
VTYIIVLAQQHSPLTVSDNGPINLGILKLLNTQLAGKGTIRLVVDIL